MLAGGSQAAPAAAPSAPADPNAWLPEKHRVLAADGALDLEASARKVAEAYTHAERRIGSGDVPPKTVDEYKVTVPEALAETIKADELAASAEFKGFLGKMHGLGLNQTQLDGVVGELLTRSEALRSGTATQSAEQCNAALSQTWPSPAVRSEQIGLAFKAFNAFAAEGDKDLMDEIGNNPVAIRLLAAVGKELQEDVPIVAGSPEANTWDDQLAAVTTHAGYMDRNHPEHSKLMARKEQLYNQRYGTKKQVLGGGVTFSMGR